MNWRPLRPEIGLINCEDLIENIARHPLLKQLKNKVNHSDLNNHQYSPPFIKKNIF